MHRSATTTPTRTRFSIAWRPSLNAVFDEVPDEGTLVLLETTAGQGANVGYRFEQLARIIDNVEQRGRLGICVDTCHVFAAGYDISGAKGWKEMISEWRARSGGAPEGAISMTPRSRAEAGLTATRTSARDKSERRPSSA